VHDTRVFPLNLARIATIVLFVALATRLAWMSDDALITLRTALNISHGWGPGFNATEAVQGYTHPLWFLLWTSIGALTNQWILGILVASIALSTIAFALVIWSAISLSRIIIAATFLILSNAFMEYTTSGLENSLAYVFIAVIYLLTIQIFNSVTQSPKQLWAILLGLSIAGLILTRSDLILVILPVGILVLWTLRTHWRFIAVSAVSALIPLFIWIAWSRVTYSAWFPNTLPAKTNLNIPRSDLLLQGFNYFRVSFENDPVTFIAIILGIICGFALGNTLVKAWTIGMVFSLAYIWWIGGDFMAGRFLAIPVLISVLILASVTLPAISTTFATVGALSLLVISASMGTIPVSLTNPQIQRWDASARENSNVVDERSFYVQNNRDLEFFLVNTKTKSENPLIAPTSSPDLQIRTLNELNAISRNWPTNTSPFRIPDGVITECGLLGTIGLAIGPRNHLIDSCALTDRFLSGIPFKPDPVVPYKPGHFERSIPAGYSEAIALNNPELVLDPAALEQLTLLWEKIR